LNSSRLKLNHTKNAELNRLRIEVIEAIVNELHTNDINTKLSHLNLDGSPARSEGASSALFSGVKELACVRYKNSTLKVLLIAGNNVGSKGGQQ
ncbi:1641_t:CDS:2, partial [Gigaspora margarita]